MKLHQDIQAALEATRLLSEALGSGNLMACTTLLDRREKALEHFARSHDQAHHQDKDACRELLKELVRADEELQALGRHHLAEASDDFHRSTPVAVESLPATACFDRKA